MDPIAVFLLDADGETIFVEDIHEYALGRGLRIDLHGGWEDIARAILEDDPALCSVEDFDETVEVFLEFP